jgi:acetyl-CoA C-acetyltransferase
MTDAVIASAVRTPIGTFNGALSSVHPVDLAVTAIAGALARTAVSPQHITDVILGSVLSAGLGQNVARQAALQAGLSDDVPAMTVNQVCGSGLRAVALAAQQVQLGAAHVVVAGGAESMSRAAYLLEHGRDGYRLGHGQLVDSMIRDGLWCAMTDVHMGTTAENIAREFGISRADQDAFAAESQRRAADALATGVFEHEIAAVEVPQRRGAPLRVTADEHPHPDATVESLAALRPAFDPAGTVTAGNSSGINDGAAAVVVMSREAAASACITPLAVVRSWATVGVSPRIMGMGPVEAIPLALARAGLALGDIGLIELNEAFAAQSLGVSRALGIDPEITNVNGGAIALGHPIGASGARILTTLVHEMQRRQVKYGLASLCIGGGQGIAMVLEHGAGAA